MSFDPNANTTLEHEIALGTFDPLAAHNPDPFEPTSSIVPGQGVQAMPVYRDQVGLEAGLQSNQGLFEALLHSPENTHQSWVGHLRSESPTIDTALRTGTELITSGSVAFEQTVTSGRGLAQETAKSIGNTMQRWVEATAESWNDPGNQFHNELNHQATTFADGLRTLATDVDNSEWMAGAKERLGTASNRFGSFVERINHHLGYVTPSDPLQEEEALAAAESRLQDNLVNLRDRPNFLEVVETAFGEGIEASEAKLLIDDFVAGDRKPEIQVVEAETLKSRGAFGNDTIFLSDQLVAGASEALDEVLLEETGHYFDDVLNPVDSPGDEGAIFARLAQGEVLSPQTLLRLKQEDDRATLILGDGSEQLIAIEQSDSRSTYEVQAGDTLWAIAERELGAGTQWTELQKEDGTTFTEAEAAQLQIGDLVYLPGEEPAPETPEVYAYTIAEGDTLWSIAERELGAGTQWTELQKGDGTSFTEAEAAQLQIGDLVYIPGEEPAPVPEPAPEPPAEDAPSTPIPPDFEAYTLTDGDTLWGIAERSFGNGNRWTEFLKEDGTSFTEAEATSLQPGQVIYIPDAPDEPTEPPVPDAPPSGIERGDYVPEVDQAFLDKVDAIATRLGATPEYLIAVMGFETGGSYSPSIPNAVGSGATGLIQFLPQTAINLGTTTEALAEMTALEQLDYVEQYLQPYEGRLNTLEDTYMAVLWPAGIGKDPDQAIMTEGDPYYGGNSGLDINDDGAITPREAADKVRAFLPGADLFGDTNETDSGGVAEPTDDGYSSVSTIWDPVTRERIATLHPTIHDEVARFINRVDAELGIKLRVTDALRSFEEQDRLYQQGRSTPGAIVTNARGGDSYHNYGLAVDVVEIVNGQANYNGDYWNRVGEIGKSEGFIWGGDFQSFVDRPHFQFTYGLSVRELKALYDQQRTAGQIAAPNQIQGFADDPAPPASPDPSTPSSPSSAYPGYTFNYEPGQSIGYDPKVEQWQQQMQDLGWDIAVDGRYGPQSQGVARDFQELYPSLENDGIVGPQTWAASFDSDAKGPAPAPVSTTAPPPAPAPPPTSEPAEDGPLEVGDRGTQVQSLQERLTELGYELPLGGADGVFGEETAAAVQNFHRDRGLDYGQSVTAQTWAALDWNYLENPEQSIPNDALSTATELTLQNDGINVRDKLGYQRSRYEFDTQDVYKFRLNQSEDIELYIGGSELKKNLQLELLDSSGNRIQFVDTLNDNRIQTSLAAGEYYARIASAGSEKTPYRLNLSTFDKTPVPDDTAHLPDPVSPDPSSPIPQPTVQDIDFELDFETNDQSLWGSGEALTDLDETYFFGADWEQEDSAGPLSGSTSGKAGIEAKLAVNSGTIDASLPIDFQFSIPENVRPGQTITIASDFSIDEAAFFETVGPKVGAALDLILETKTNLSASALGKTIKILDDVEIKGKANLLEFGQQPEDESNTGQTDESDTGQEDEEEQTKSQKILGAGELKLKAPKVDTRGSFEGDLASSSDKGEFLTAKLDLDKLASTFIPSLPPLGVEKRKVGPVEFGYDLIDVKLFAELLLKQEFSLALESMLGQLTLENGDVIDFKVGEDISYTVPEDYNFGTSLEIEASFEPETELRNKTNLSFGVGVDLKALSATGKFNAPWPVPDIGLDIGPVFEKKFTPFEGDLFSIYDDAFALKGWGPETKSFEITIA